MPKDWTGNWFTGKELLQMIAETDPKKHSIRSICPEGQGMTLFGPESCLKSSTTIELAAAMCNGDDWYGIETIPPKSLYIFFEGEPGGLSDKVRRALKKYPHAHLDNIIFKHLDDIALDTDAGRKELEALIRSLPWTPDVIFFDPYRGCIEGYENDSRAAKRYVNNISNLGCRIIYHHPPSEQAG